MLNIRMFLALAWTVPVLSSPGLAADPTEQYSKWEEFLQLPSMFALLDCLSKGGKSAHETEGLAYKVRTLVARTLDETDQKLDETRQKLKKIRQASAVPPSGETQQQRTERDLVRRRASALWVGVRLESHRALYAEERDEAARNVLSYLTDLRACLRAFPPTLLEETEDKSEAERDRRDKRIRLWHQAMGEFGSYEADARLVLGPAADEFDGQDPQTRAELWVLDQFGPYNEDESTHNARLMQTTSNTFREVERLAKQAVAVRVQASVALSKVYGWPPKKEQVVKKDGTKIEESILEAPSALFDSEKTAFVYEPLTVVREQKPVDTKALDDTSVKMIGLTASGNLEGVVAKYADTRRALDWNDGHELIGSNDGKEVESLFNGLTDRYKHRELWGTRLNWGSEPLKSWLGKDDRSAAYNSTSAGSVQSLLLIWAKGRVPDRSLETATPNVFGDPIVLQFKDVTPHGASEKQYRLVGWREQLEKMTKNWETTRNMILADQRFADAQNANTGGPQHRSLASQHLYNLRKRAHGLRESFRLTEQSLTGLNGRINCAVYDAIAEHLQEKKTVHQTAEISGSRASFVEELRTVLAKNNITDERWTESLPCILQHARVRPQSGQGETARPAPQDEPKDLELLRDSEFGRLNFAPGMYVEQDGSTGLVTASGYDRENWATLATDERRLNTIRKAMAHLYDSATEVSKELTNVQKAKRQQELSQQIADYFILQWMIDQIYEIAPNEMDNRPLWAKGYLNRKQKAIGEALRLGQSNSTSATGEETK